MVQDGFWHEDAVRLAEEGEPSHLLDLIGASMPTTRRTQPLLTWAQDLAQRIPDPGEGGTRVRWEALATVAARDLVAARVLEPVSYTHLTLPTNREV